MVPRRLALGVCRAGCALGVARVSRQDLPGGTVATSHTLVDSVLPVVDGWSVLARWDCSPDRLQVAL